MAPPERSPLTLSVSPGLVRLVFRLLVSVVDAATASMDLAAAVAVLAI
jgi:hypothetical protein